MRLNILIRFWVFDLYNMLVLVLKRLSSKLLQKLLKLLLHQFNGFIKCPCFYSLSTSKPNINQLFSSVFLLLIIFYIFFFCLLYYFFFFYHITPKKNTLFFFFFFFFFSLKKKKR